MLAREMYSYSRNGRNDRNSWLSPTKIGQLVLMSEHPIKAERGVGEWLQGGDFLPPTAATFQPNKLVQVLLYEGEEGMVYNESEQKPIV